MKTRIVILKKFPDFKITSLKKKEIHNKFIAELELIYI